MPPTHRKFIGAGKRYERTADKEFIERIIKARRALCVGEEVRVEK